MESSPFTSEQVFAAFDGQWETVASGRTRMIHDQLRHGAPRGGEAELLSWLASRISMVLPEREFRFGRAELKAACGKAVGPPSADTLFRQAWETVAPERVATFPDGGWFLLEPGRQLAPEESQDSSSAGEAKSTSEPQSVKLTVVPVAPGEQESYQATYLLAEAFIESLLADVSARFLADPWGWAPKSALFDMWMKVMAAVAAIDATQDGDQSGDPGDEQPAGRTDGPDDADTQAVPLTRVRVDATQAGALVHPLPGGLSHEQLCAYLSGAPVVMAARTRLPDAIDPSLAPVPVAFYTDGRYVWSAELVAYVKRHLLAVPVELLQHVAANGGVVPEVTEASMQAARALVGNESSP